MTKTRLDIQKWVRKEHFEFFNTFEDPSYSLCFDVDVSQDYDFAKNNDVPFFAKYLYACTCAMNSVDNFKYRISNNEVFVYDTIHVSATILRPNNTFGFSFIKYSNDFKQFFKSYVEEKERILDSNELFPPVNGPDCYHCSALPWVNFTGHKEPFKSSGNSIPQVAFSKIRKENNKILMKISLTVNHALIDGYHVGLFIENFQYYLNQ